MSLSAREFQVLVRRGESIRDRMTVLERCCQRSGLNYFPPDLLEPDNGGENPNPTILLEYQQPMMGKEFVPVLSARWKILKLRKDPQPNERDLMWLSTGFRHVTWARPIITDDTVLAMTRSNKKFDPIEIDAFFERAKMLTLVHKERVRKLNVLATEREALDYYITLFRAIGAFGTAGRTHLPKRAVSYMDLLPREGERLTWIEHLSFLTGACRSNDPWVLMSEAGRITDHVIQGIDPLHQNGKRITFRLGGGNKR